MGREVLHAHRDGWESALTHPRSVVIDYPAKILRQGTEKLDLHGKPRTFAVIAFLLRGADTFHARRAIAQAVYGTPDIADHQVTAIVMKAQPIVRWLGMTLETAYALGIRLHSDPRETLPCRDQIAPSQQPPTLVKSPGDAAIASRRRPQSSWVASPRNTRTRTSPPPAFGTKPGP